MGKNYMHCTRILVRIMTGYYDYVLGLIPLTLLGFTALLQVAGVSLTAAIPVASSVPVLLIGHALFVNGPVESTPAEAVPATPPVNAD